MINKINTENAPKAIGPYSQAIEVETLIITSGELPINPKSGKIETNNISDQTKQSLENVKAILEVKGRSMSDIIKTTVFLSDIKEFAEMNEVYNKYFSDPYPARSCFQVAALPMDAKVEIEVICGK
ncbi:MAG TPA: reactive intermediate/imine deaminase [Fusobacteriaceae bacterium]|nr:reactive intermediate/imine deaminase [Fusobacteriaceae bacterium]